MIWDFRPAVVPWLLLSTFLLVLARVIYARQSASRVARLFCLMIGLVATWFFAIAVGLSTTEPVLAAVSGRFVIAAAAILPAAIFDFTSTALRISEQRTWAIRASWALGVLSAFLILFSNVIVAVEPYQFSWGFYPQLTPFGGWAFVIYFTLTLLHHIIDGAREYLRSDDPERRSRIGRLMISFLIVYAALLDFRAAFGIDSPPLGWIPVSAFIAFAWPTIRHHRFAPITAARAAADILETMADGLFVLDQAGRVRVMNRAARNLFGYGEADLMGRSLAVLEPHENRPTIGDDLQELVAHGPVRDHERIFTDRNGRPIDVSISISPVHDTSSGGSVVIVRDIRERKRDEKELRTFTERLQQSNRELEDFAHVASHDLQEPLRKIQAFGDRLATRFGASIPPEGLDYLTRMQNAASRMQVLINDLLSFSRVTTQGRPFAPVDLSVIVAEVLHDLEVKMQATSAVVTVEGLPTIDADALQIRQLFQNLIGNALKFHRSDEAPRIGVSSRLEEDWAVIEVSDNGIGFDQKYAERIFTIFERLHGRTTYEGTGIGLAICRKIVERHHGSIAARSVSGQGTTFEVRLPQRQAREKEIE